ncbi:MAG: hypothetical protein PHF21_03275 [Bacilli bacterium]|nr:hypothetical protein [Bacilli bacterium]
MKKEIEITWLDVPEEHDYAAAVSYLSLIYDASLADNTAKELHSDIVQQFKAKDIFRASGLSLLGISNSHVKKNVKKIKKGIKLSPILLVRDTQNGKVIIADGYHRVCAVYLFNEDALIPCKIC